MSIKNVANIGWTNFVFDFIHKGAYIKGAGVCSLVLAAGPS